MIRRPPRSTLFPSPTLFRSPSGRPDPSAPARRPTGDGAVIAALGLLVGVVVGVVLRPEVPFWLEPYLPIAVVAALDATFGALDRKSTRLNSSHANISYAVFC